MRLHHFPPRTNLKLVSIGLWIALSCLFISSSSLSQIVSLPVHRLPGTTLIIPDFTRGAIIINDIGIADNKEIDKIVRQLRLLKEYNFHSLEIIISHKHGDHYKGLIKLAERADCLNLFDTIKIIYPFTADAQEMANKVLEHHPELKGNIRAQGVLDSKDVLNVGYPDKGVEIRFFKAENRRTLSINANSLITEIYLRDRVSEFLIVNFADTDTTGLRLWKAHAKVNNIIPNVIILPHHGANTTDISVISEYLANAKWIIITVNKGNNKHPGMKTLRHLKKIARNNKILFTGYDGDILIEPRKVVPLSNELDIFDLTYYRLRFTSLESPNSRQLPYSVDLPLMIDNNRRLGGCDDFDSILTTNISRELIQDAIRRANEPRKDPSILTAEALERLHRYNRGMGILGRRSWIGPRISIKARGGK